MQRVIGIIVGVLVLFWVISSPNSAANFVDNIFGLILGALRSIVNFLQALF